MFSNAQEFYEHLDDCVLRVVQQEVPSEAINEQRLAEVANDQDVQDTLDRHQIPTGSEPTAHSATSLDEEDEEDDADDSRAEGSEESWPASSRDKPRSGKGTMLINRGNTS